jgi:hypothetical protein
MATTENRQKFAAELAVGLKHWPQLQFYVKSSELPATASWAPPLVGNKCFEAFLQILEDALYYANGRSDDLEKQFKDIRD